MIEIVAVDGKFAHSSYDLCILSSPAAVRYFVPHYSAININKFICVGQKTADALKAATGRDDSLVPDKFYMADVAAMLGDVDLAGKKVLSPGAAVRATDMEGFFSERGAIYEAVTTYQTIPVSYEKGYVDSFINRCDINVVTFFSPSAVRAFFSQAALSSAVTIVAIGTTTKAAVPAGYEVLMPEMQTAEGIIELLRR
jgi:uroporphyrinogen-III synthase